MLVVLTSLSTIASQKLMQEVFMGSMDLGVVRPPVADVSTRLFEAFIDGPAAYQARDELAATIAETERGLLEDVGKSALGQAAELLTPGDIDVNNFPALAQTSLFLEVNKVRLDRADQILKAEHAALASLFFNKEVRVIPIDKESYPITRHYFSTGLMGSRRYEPSDFFRQRAHGHITEINRKTGQLWVTSKVGTGRISRFFGDPGKWSVDMVDPDTKRPLVSIEFVD